MRQQNVAQWVNLQLLLFRGHKEPPPPPPDTFQHPCSPLSPRLKLLLTCTISQLFQDESPQQPSHAFAKEGIVSLTPCVLCLHHFSGQILPRRALPSAPLVEFSITSHVRATLGFATRPSPMTSFNGAN